MQVRVHQLSSRRGIKEGHAIGRGMGPIAAKILDISPVLIIVRTLLEQGKMRFSKLLGFNVIAGQRVFAQCIQTKGLPVEMSVGLRRLSRVTKARV